MYKVLIADDEIPIRDWLEICVNSTGCKCKVVAKASNGRAALEKYQETLPDIVITDIKMPFMDGIDLITKIREQNKEIPVVILTSYNEFSYARQALSQGVTEYILKTEVTVERMKELLDKIIENLERRSSWSGRDSYQLERRKSKFLNKCLTEEKSWGKEQLAAELHALEIPLAESSIGAVAFRDGEGSLGFTGERFGDIRVAAIFPLYRENSLALCNLPVQASQNRQRETLYRMASYILDQTGSSVGVSDIYSGYGYLPVLIKESAVRLSQSFYDQKPCVHQLETFRSDPKTLSDLREMQQAFEDSAKAADYEDSRKRLEELIRFISIRKPSDIQMVRNTCMNMLKYFYYSYASEAGRKLAHMEHIMAEIENSSTIYDIQKFVGENIRQIQEDYDKTQAQYSAPVQKSIDYLRQNYEKNLTLPVISSYAGYSPDYFSRIFKEETGINFSSYLTKYRLKKALELLQTTNMKVYEVSIAVGYSNMSYFSTVFKKEYGVNPFDFKSSSKQKREAVVISAKTHEIEGKNEREN